MAEEDTKKRTTGSLSDILGPELSKELGYPGAAGGRRGTGSSMPLPIPTVPKPAPAPPPGAAATSGAKEASTAFSEAETLVDTRLPLPSPGQQAHAGPIPTGGVTSAPIPPPVPPGAGGGLGFAPLPPGGTPSPSTIGIGGATPGAPFPPTAGAPMSTGPVPFSAVKVTVPGGGAKPEPAGDVSVETVDDEDFEFVEPEVEELSPSLEPGMSDAAAGDVTAMEPSGAEEPETESNDPTWVGPAPDDEIGANIQPDSYTDTEEILPSEVRPPRGFGQFWRSLGLLPVPILICVGGLLFVLILLPWALMLLNSKGPAGSTAYLTADHALMAGPGDADDYPTVAMLELNEELQVLEPHGQWALVRDPLGRTGYLPAGSLADSMQPSRPDQPFTRCRQRVGEPDASACTKRAAEQRDSCRGQCRKAGSGETCTASCVEAHDACMQSCTSKPVETAFPGPTAQEEAGAGAQEAVDFEGDAPAEEEAEETVEPDKEELAKKAAKKKKKRKKRKRKKKKKRGR